MRHLLFVFALIISTPFIFSQTLNHTVTDKDGDLKLLGKVDENGLKKAPFAEWFNKYHEDYLINTAITKQLKDSLNQYQIKVFFGSWCGDSKRELPKFYKILESIKFPENQLEVIAVDDTEEAYKQSPNHEEKGYNIHRVPTFIFIKDNKEINRIVEYPKETLERDMLKIVNNERYIPNYNAANYMFYMVNETPLEDLKSNEQFWSSRLAEFVNGSKELNTLGYIFLRSNQIEKALYIFDLNTKIFPNGYNVYDSLGEAYFKAEKYTDALKNYYKVLSLKPDDKNAVEMIEKIKTAAEKNKS